MIFELYGDPHDFAVRTVGLPAIGVAGVCFGRVITSQAPTNHAFNWGMVLAHELAHVFAIELSRSRVPRWFTEGLSEVETARLRPEWTRHDDTALYAPRFAAASCRRCCRCPTPSSPRAATRRCGHTRRRRRPSISSSAASGSRHCARRWWRSAAAKPRPRCSGR